LIAASSSVTISRGKGCGLKVAASTQATRYEPSQMNRPVPRS